MIITTLVYIYFLGIDQLFLQVLQLGAHQFWQEYEGVDEICVQKAGRMSKVFKSPFNSCPACQGAIVKEDKVVLIDDLVATGRLTSRWT